MVEIPPITCPNCGEKMLIDKMQMDGGKVVASRVIPYLGTRFAFAQPPTRQQLLEKLMLLQEATSKLNRQMLGLSQENRSLKQENNSLRRRSWMARRG